MQKRVVSLPLRGVGYLAILALGMGLISGCAKSDIRKALNIANSSSATREIMPPIYDAVTDAHPEMTDEVEAFDAAWRQANLTVKNTIAAIQAGTEPNKSIKDIIAPILAVLDEFKIEEKVPELKPTLDLLRSILEIV